MIGKVEFSTDKHSPSYSYLGNGYSCHNIDKKIKTLLKLILNLGRLVSKLHFYHCTIPHLNKSRFILESRFTEQT